MIYSTNGSFADFQAKYALADHNDTITLPEGTFTDWDINELILTKGVKIQGEGSGRVVARSRTRLKFGTGAKVFTVQEGFSIPLGTVLRVWRFPSDKDSLYMLGTVTSIVGTTLTLEVTECVEAGPDTFTADDATDILTSVGSNFAAWTQLQFTSTGTLPGGLDPGTSYYVSPNSLTADSFQLKTAPGGGSTIDITSTGTGIHTWHRAETIWLFGTEPKTRIVFGGTVLDDSLLSLSENTTVGIEVSGINFVNTGNGHTIAMSYVEGGKPHLVHDCWFHKFTNPSSSATVFAFNTNQGVLWNCSFTGTAWQFSTSNALDFTVPTKDEVWQELSKFGTADTDGQGNVYIEDCDFHGYTTSTDFSANSRVVVRDSLFDHAGLGSHGYDTGPFGARHWQIYRNRFEFANLGNDSLPSINHALLRGGTGYIFENYFEDITSEAWSDKPEIQFGIWCLGRWNTLPGHYSGNDGGIVEYPAPRQIGFGFVTGLGLDGQGNATSGDFDTYVGDSEPIRLWNNTGLDAPFHISTDGTPGVENIYGVVPDDPNDYFQLNRDYFLDDGPPVGFEPFEYPHPLRDGGAVPDTTPPEIDTVTVSVDGDEVAIVFDEAVEFGAGGSGGFALDTSSGTVALTYVSGTGTATHHFTPARTILGSEVVSLDFVQPGDGAQDGSANELASVSGVSVTNGSTQGAASGTLVFGTATYPSNPRFPAVGLIRYTTSPRFRLP